MVKRSVLLVLVLLALTFFAYPASASLIPMSWGFPVMVQNSSLTGLTSSIATASDLEAATISFPTGGIGGMFGGAFPTIGQFGNMGSSLSNLGFMNQNQNMYFAYPFISIGGSPIPGMGML